LPTAPQNDIFSANVEHLRKFLVNRILFIREIHPPTSKRPKLTAEHGLPDVAIAPFSGLKVIAYLDALIVMAFINAYGADAPIRYCEAIAKRETQPYGLFSLTHRFFRG
jgi:hypothetical protein